MLPMCRSVCHNTGWENLSMIVPAFSLDMTIEVVSRTAYLSSAEMVGRSYIMPEFRSLIRAISCLTRASPRDGTFSLIVDVK